MENIQKSKAQREAILARAYKLLEENNEARARIKANDNFRRNRLIQPQAAYNKPSITSNTNKMLTPPRADRLKELLETVESSSYPLKYTRAYLLNKIKRGAGYLHHNMDVENDEDLNDGDDDLEHLVKEFPEVPRNRFGPKWSSCTYKVPDLETIDEEPDPRPCELDFYLELVRCCMDTRYPLSYIDKMLRDHKCKRHGGALPYEAEFE